MTVRVAINGLGRIGRATMRTLLGQSDHFELVAVNDLAPADNLAYLLRNDSVYGPRAGTTRAEDSQLVVDGRLIEVLSCEDPASLPWGEWDVELVFECTGRFRTGPDLRKHLDAGARRVILSAPAKDDSIPIVVPGVNGQDGMGADMVSTASCTTNCIAPIMEILDRRIGVRKATMSTVHAYTAGQELVDGPAGDWRRGRAAATNIVPSTTGAAQAAAKVVPQVAGRFDGAALRVPVVDGSIADIVAVLARETTVGELEHLFRAEADGDRYRGIVGVTDDPLVSSDIIGDTHAAMIDLGSLTVTDGDLVKVMAWYDNEGGYARQMVRFARQLVGQPAGTGQ